MLIQFLLAVFSGQIRVKFCSLLHLMSGGLFDLSVLPRPTPQSAFKYMHVPGTQFIVLRINNTLPPQTW